LACACPVEIAPPLYGKKATNQQTLLSHPSNLQDRGAHEEQSHLLLYSFLFRLFSRHSHRRFPGFAHGCLCGQTELYEHSHAYSYAVLLMSTDERGGSGVATDENGYRGDSDMRQKVWPECGSGTQPTGRVLSKGLHFDQQSHGRLRHVPELPVSVQTTGDTSASPHF